MNHLKLLRSQHGISQQKLADYLNVSQQSVYKYENDIAEPDIQTLKSLSNLFQTSIDYIVGNTDNPQKIDYYTETKLTEHELQHIQSYRKLSEQRKKIVDMIVLDYLENNSRL